MNFFVLTLFPDFFEAFKNHSIIKKGLDKNKFSVQVHNIRDYAVNKYGQVDDAPYGGGHGMLLRPEPIFDTYKSLNLSENKKVIFFSPKGKQMDYNTINDMLKIEDIVLICGHYEGIDQRIIDLIVDEQISIGDFVLTGGEIPAMMLIDSCIRQLDGVIRKESVEDESFTNGLLEYRQYTRPPVFQGLKVPDVLISGNHKLIEEYKKKDSIEETKIFREDLLKQKKNIKK